MRSPQAGVELERGTVVEDEARVVGSRGSAQRSLLSDGDAVDLGAVAGDFTDTVAAVGRDAMAKALFAVAHGDDPLRVSVPGNVVDAAGDDVVFACVLSAGEPSRGGVWAHARTLGCTFTNAIPHPDGTSNVTAGNVEARGREAGYGGLGGVRSVLLRVVGIIDGANEDGFVGSVCYAFSLGIG